MQSEEFTFETWSAVGSFCADPQVRDHALSVTDVMVSPENHYVFAVMAGPVQVVSFLFRDLPHALQAARDLRDLLPRIETARLGLPKTNLPFGEQS